ncbi:MAG: amidohydrolase [Porticoccaceae bacterium]|jgi:predicted TIM-barrel fold metal-dependent hydrolase|nr:amidohydrolase [Porticoccaceae bacterium]
MSKPVISADSHIAEPPNCYIDFIDPKFRDRAPHMVEHEQYGDIYVIEGLEKPVPMGLVAAAGRKPEELKTSGMKFADLPRSSWDAKYRVADQDRDGVAAELIYPTVGMMLCNHPDIDYQVACFDAYNRWLEGYIADAPAGRLFGLGQVALRSVDEGIKELERAKQRGFVGVMMTGNPPESDYHDPLYDPLWEAAVDLDLPLSFHILTSKADSLNRQRGPKINGFLAIMRGCQDILGTFVFGGVFERHPRLKVVCAEADAGWVPHFIYRMDHAYDRHRYWMKCPPLEKMPSEYFQSNIYLTFQDDWTAFRHRDEMNPRRLMWANDFPHSDSTWPWSQEILAEHTRDMSEEEKDWILHDNVVECYNLPV